MRPLPRWGEAEQPGPEGDAAHRLRRRRRPRRLPARAAAAGASLHHAPAARRARRRQRHPALRGGGRRPRPHRRAPARACRSIPLDSIVGTVDRTRDFDRQLPADLRPGARALGADRRRHAPRRVAAAHRRLPGRRAALRARRPPPRVGRPRARALATSTPTSPRCAPASATSRELRLADLPLKGHERLFLERVPLPPEPRASASRLSDPLGLRRAGRGRRGLGLPAMQERGEFLDRARGRARVVRRRVPAGGRACCARPDLLGPGTEADAYHARQPRSATGCCARTSGATR